MRFLFFLPNAFLRLFTDVTFFLLHFFFRVVFNHNASSVLRVFILILFFF